MSEIQSIQWFPGHMAKTRRLIAANLKLVDAVAEIVDARIPLSSRNPEIDGLINGKPKMLVLNKADMADSSATAKWMSYYKSENIRAIAADCRTGSGLKSFVPEIRILLADLLKKREEKGIQGRPIHIMIVGIPNAGKSSLINRLAQSKRANVEDRPGVTRNKQWVKLDNNVELLDMPGVLWPKFEDKIVGERLAFTGAVRDEIIDIEALAMRLLEQLSVSYPQTLVSRYGIEILESDTGYELLEKVGRKRGMLVSGGDVDTERAAITVLDEFRSAKLGRITLELPPEKRIITADGMEKI